MKNFFRFIIAAVLAVACTPEAVEQPEVNGNDADTGVYHDMIVLGRQLEDPYSVENVTRALESLYPTKADRVVVEPTDYYVRFLPTGEEQIRELESLGIMLIDHPVDFEIIREGDYYHDPSIKEGDMTWQYAVVRKGFRFPPDIRHEILDKCYLAENDQSGTKAGWVDWEEVEREAYRLTGNGEMLPATKGEDNVPEGRITIIDDFSGHEVGVSGVRVSCHSFVKFSHAFTDKDGYYKMGRSFPSEVRYRLVFKNRKGFALGFNLLLQPASCSALGKTSPSGLSAVVDKDSDRRLYTRCVVSNAAYDYYEGCESDKGRIRTPPANLRIWLFQNMRGSSAAMMQQGTVVDGSKIGAFLGDYSSLLEMFLPDITLGLKDVDSYAAIYSATQHELAHASHFMQVGVDYWKNYIDFILTSYVKSGFVAYGVGTEKNHGYCEIGEMWAFYYQTMAFREKYDTDITFGTGYWFSPQIFIQLDERGLNRFKIFNALTSDITNIEMLQSRLISLYPENRSLINQIFGRY